MPVNQQSIVTHEIFSLRYKTEINANTKALYKKLRKTSNANIGHLDNRTSGRAALFSGIQVVRRGHSSTAAIQMSPWIVASIRKKEALAQVAGVQPTAIVEPFVIVAGGEHYIYYAFPDSNNPGSVRILGPDTITLALVPDSIRGIFQVFRLYGNIMEYGMDESEHGYWGGNLEPILKKLADSPELQDKFPLPSLFPPCDSDEEKWIFSRE